MRGDVVGSNPCTRYWMETVSHFIVVKIVMNCLKRPKINKKETGNHPFIKNYVTIQL